MFKCRVCGEYFNEPHRYVETHGFTSDPFESWSVCPYCGESDYDEDYLVEAEEAEAEAEADAEEVDGE